MRARLHARGAATRPNPTHTHARARVRALVRDGARVVLVEEFEDLKVLLRGEAHLVLLHGFVELKEGKKPREGGGHMGVFGIGGGVTRRVGDLTGLQPVVVMWFR